MSRKIASTALTLSLALTSCHSNPTSEQKSVGMMDGNKIVVMYYENFEVKFQSCQAGSENQDKLFIDQDLEYLKKNCLDVVKVMTLKELNDKVKALVASPDFTRLEAIKAADLSKMQSEVAGYKQKVQDLNDEIEILFSGVPDSDSEKQSYIDQRDTLQGLIDGFDTKIVALSEAIDNSANDPSRKSLVDFDVKNTIALAKDLNLSSSNYALAFTKMIAEKGSFFILNEKEHTLLSGIVLSFEGNSPQTFDPMKWLSATDAVLATPGKGLPIVTFVANQLDGKPAILSAVKPEGCEWLVFSNVQNSLLISGDVPASFKGKECKVVVTASGASQKSSKELLVKGRTPRIEKKPNQCSMKQVTVSDDSIAPTKFLGTSLETVVFEGLDLFASPAACGDYFKKTTLVPEITNREYLSPASPYYAQMTSPVALSTDQAPACRYNNSTVACRDPVPGSNIGTCSSYNKYIAQYKQVTYTIPTKNVTVKVDPTCPDTVDVEIYD